LEFNKILSKITEKEAFQNAREEQLTSLEKKIEDGLPEEDNLMKISKELHFERDEAKAKQTRLEVELESLRKNLSDIQKLIQTTTVHNQELIKLRNRVMFCEQAMDMLSSENAIEIEKIRQELTVRLQKRFGLILHSNKTAELDENFILNILENGKPTPKSDGEDKLISLIFISTLIEMAKDREMSKDSTAIDPGAGIYPIVIDSPYGEFDSVYKKNISEAVKTLAPQVIILLNQEHWNEGQTLGPIFEDSLAHQYALIAHRPKLDILDSERNVLKIGNGPKIDLEVQDVREYTSIQRIEVI
jgi:DNA sulfur modification protein DndD